jgi:general secretion pathway protein G
MRDLAPVRKRRRDAGFSLIELVITVAIIGLLASVAAPLAETVYKRSRENDLRNALMTIRNAIDAYKDATDAGRIARAADESGYPRSLAELVEGIEDKRNPKGAKIYLLRRVPRDPFADPGQSPENSWGLRSYESPPDDPKPGRDVFDVYSLSSGTGLNGIPYRQW